MLSILNFYFPGQKGSRNNFSFFFCTRFYCLELTKISTKTTEYLQRLNKSLSHTRLRNYYFNDTLQVSKLFLSSLREFSFHEHLFRVPKRRRGKARAMSERCFLLLSMSVIIISDNDIARCDRCGTNLRAVAFRFARAAHVLRFPGRD